MLYVVMNPNQNKAFVFVFVLHWNLHFKLMSVISQNFNKTLPYQETHCLSYLVKRLFLLKWFTFHWPLCSFLFLLFDTQPTILLVLCRNLLSCDWFILKIEHFRLFFRRVIFDNFRDKHGKHKLERHHVREKMVFPFMDSCWRSSYLIWIRQLSTNKGCHRWIYLQISCKSSSLFVILSY